MIIEKFTLSIFQQHTRLVACEATNEAIVIDPAEPCPELAALIRDRGFRLTAIALTHGHLDHGGGALFLKTEFPDAEVILHADDEPLYYSIPQQPLMMGISPHQLAAMGLDYGDPPQVTSNWQHGETFNVGGLSFEIRHCPGHTPGHVVLIEHEHKQAFVGDCLFEGSIGRTDLPGGSYDQLMTSITEQLLPLDDDFIVHSGHGRETTIGRERDANPFLNGTYNLSRGRFV